MSDPPLSDIDIKNKMAWIWTTLNWSNFSSVKIMIFFQIIKVNDKERVAAALEKDSMIRLVDQCINNEEG